MLADVVGHLHSAAFGWKGWAMALPPRRGAAVRGALPFLVMAQPSETVMPPAFSFRASDVLVPGPGQTPKANRRALEILSQSLLNFLQEQTQWRETGAERQLCARHSVSS